MGFTILLNVCSPSLLCFWMPLRKKQGVISEDIAAEMEANQEETTEPPRLETNPSKRETLPESLFAAYGNNTREMAMHQMSSRAGAHDLYRNDDENVESAMQYLLKEEWSYIYEHIVAQFGPKFSIMDQ